MLKINARKTSKFITECEVDTRHAFKLAGSGDYNTIASHSKLFSSERSAQGPRHR